MEYTIVTKINTEIIKTVFPNILTSEVILTNERKNHILERHPQDYDLFKDNVKFILDDPDYIFISQKNKDTLFYVAYNETAKLNIVIRLALAEGSNYLKNSIITSFSINDIGIRKMVRKNKILYKKE